MSNQSGEVDAMVIFGITGDLARKMTFRALYRLERRGLLQAQIYGVGRRELDDEQLRATARDAICEQEDRVDQKALDRFSERLSYIRGDLDDPDLFRTIKERLSDDHPHAFYLETPPSLFIQIVEGLAAAGLLGDEDRLLIEKPYGHDVASARELGEQLHRHLDERQLYRIDHFLGKLALRWLLDLRFESGLLEPIWNREQLDCVQITMAEPLSVEGRGGFYDPVGQLRDDVANHLLQVLTAAAMERPEGQGPEARQAAEQELLSAVADADPDRYVRGQYDGYRETDGVASDSDTETYAALELRIENDRWRDVPFLIRAGKELAAKCTELRVLFKGAGSGEQPDRERRPVPPQLVLRLDPTPGLRLRLGGGEDGAIPRMLQAESGDEAEVSETPYERLLGAALAGDREPFVSQENAEQRWRIVQPLLERPGELHAYECGSWGPSQADAIAAPYGGWREPWLSE